MHTEIVSLERYKEVVAVAKSVFEKNNLEDRMRLV